MTRSLDMCACILKGIPYDSEKVAHFSIHFLQNARVNFCTKSARILLHETGRFKRRFPEGFSWLEKDPFWVDRLSSHMLM